MCQTAEVSRERTQAEDQIDDAARLEQGGTENGKVIQVVKKKQDVIDSHKLAEDITEMMEKVTENQKLAEDITKMMQRVTKTENHKLAKDITKAMQKVAETENHKLAANGVTEVAKGAMDARIAGEGPRRVPNGEGPRRVPDVTKASHKPQTEMRIKRLT